MSTKVVVVIPTNRDLSFLETWRSSDLREATLVVVEDGATRNISLPPGFDVLVFCWQDIDRELSDKSWIIGRRSGTIRSYGFLKAWQLGADVIISLDDDCEADGSGKDFVAGHVKALSERVHASPWVNSLGNPGLYVRGIPLSERREIPVAVNLGLWRGIPDLDGETQLAFPNPPESIPVKSVVRKGNYVALCTMNLAFRRELLPAFYMPVMGKEVYGFDRFGDIWAGVFAKKVCDHLDRAVLMGEPFVSHQRRSDPHRNKEKEEEGKPLNELLWRHVDKMVLEGFDVSEVYGSLASQLANTDMPRRDYFSRLSEAMLIWLDILKRGA
jgi:hypothetical protein